MTLFVAASAAHGAVGRITASQGAQLSSGGAPFVYARVQLDVNNGDVVRTARKCFAEVTFRDASVIRVNERTDMVIQDASSLRKIRLNQGALWVRDSRGSNTRVVTPVGTATARGTVFTVTSQGVVRVYEGFVDLESGGSSLELGPGDVGAVGPDSLPIKLESVVLSNLPTDPSGEILGWWMFDRSPTSRPGIMPGDMSGFGAFALPLAAMGGLGNRSVDPPVSAVPEPASLVALGIGAALLLKRRASR